MDLSLLLNQQTRITQSFQTYFQSFLSQEPIQRIKNVAFDVFSKISDSIKTFNNQSKEINIKTIAMLGCLSLIAIFVISLLRGRERQLIAAPPLRKDDNKLLA